MMKYTLVALGATLCRAGFTITDPSDEMNNADWAADNALLMDYDVPYIEYQTIAIVGPHSYSGEAANISHTTLSTSGNDTSVLIVANSSDVKVDHTTIVKYGYASNILQSSFFGVNAAINVANDSIATLTNTNITTHNGAAGVYAYGTHTEVHATNTWLYSSGPVSHGLYAGGNGTVYAKNVRAFSGGYRSSIFSGDIPAGYVHVEDAVARTDGVGSAICYALGLCNMTNIVGHASQSPVMFSDGTQTGVWTNCDVTAGRLGGIVMFSSQTRQSGASVTLDHTRLTVLGSETPGLWFGNVIATADVIASAINNTASGILAVANFSQITQDFNQYASYVDNTAILPAELTLNVAESSVEGSLVAYNGSSIAINLIDYSSWTGTTSVGYGAATFAVSLDATSNWTLSATATLQNFTNADALFANIQSAGFNITYDASSPANEAWGGKTFDLPGGGKLTAA